MTRGSPSKENSLEPVAPLPDEELAPPIDPQRQRPHRRRLVVAALTVVVLSALLGVSAFWLGRGDRRGARAAPTCVLVSFPTGTPDSTLNAYWQGTYAAGRLTDASAIADDGILIRFLDRDAAETMMSLSGFDQNGASIFKEAREGAVVSGVHIVSHGNSCAHNPILGR